MIMDAELLFSNAQAITASAASTNLLDLKAARDIGAGEDITFVCLVTSAFTDGGSDSTLTVTIETDDNEAFASPKTAQTVGTLAALSPAGAKLVAQLQIGVDERFVRAYYTVAGGSFTTAAVTSFMVLDADFYKVYPINQAILG